MAATDVIRKSVSLAVRRAEARMEADKKYRCFLEEIGRRLNLSRVKI